LRVESELWQDAERFIDREHQSRSTLSIGRTPYLSHPNSQLSTLNSQLLTKMDLPESQLLLKRVINIKAVVTQRWKEETQALLQSQISELDGQLQQLEIQGQRAVAEIQKQSLQPPGPQVLQQIESIQVQVNQQKSELLEQKNMALQQLQQVQFLELNQEVNQGQVEGYFGAKLGDNLIAKMNVEILLHDGVIMEIRGTI
jgi:hypothetical protein